MNLLARVEDDTAGPPSGELNRELLRASPPPSAPAPRPPRRLGSTGFALLCVFVGVLGLFGGLLAGLPGMVTRAGERVLHRVEARLGVQLTAESVAWTWDGDLQATRVTLRDRKTGDVLATAEAVAVDATVAPWERTVTVNSIHLSSPALAITRTADGHTNLDALLAALRASSADSAAPRSRSVHLTPRWPKITLENARIALAPGPIHLPLGLAVPANILFESGTLSLIPDTGTDTGAWRTTPLTLTARFGSTSLDPGQALAFSAHGSLATLLDSFTFTPERPIRFWVGRRVLGLGAISLASDSVSLSDVQLSVPIPTTPDAHAAAEIAAAATLKRLTLTASLPALIAAIAQAPAASRLEAAVGATSAIALDGLALTVSPTATGGHSFDDLTAALSPPTTPGTAPTTPGTAPTTPGTAPTTPSTAPSAAPTLQAAATRLTARLEDAATRLHARLTALLDRLPETRLTLRDSELALATPHATFTFTGLALDAARATGITIQIADIRSLGPASLTLKRAGETLSLDATLPPLPLADLGSFARRAHLLTTGGRPTGTLALPTFHLDLARAGASFTATGNALLQGVSFTHPAVAHDALGPFDLDLTGTLDWDAATEHLAVRDLTLTSRGVTLHTDLDVAQARSAPKLALHLDLPETPTQRFIDAIPQGFIPRLTGLQIEGTLTWPVAIALDTRDPGAIQIDSAPKTKGFRVTSLGSALSLAALRTAISYTIRLSDGTPGTRMVGPATGSWVPLDAITPYLPLALTTTEDGTFATNDGVSTFAMRESIATNLARGSFVRGASTITQQLVKNLFFSGEKTISRKIQEIFIAWQLTQVLSKDEIMALYLNTIEFGPGLYGIGDASLHWFGKRPIDLTLTEAVFLASIIPGPRRYYSFFTQGAVTPRWRSYLETLLKVMVTRKKITPEAFLAEAPYEPRFRGRGGGYRDAPPPGFDEIPDREELDPAFAPEVPPEDDQAPDQPPDEGHPDE